MSDVLTAAEPQPYEGLTTAEKIKEMVDIREERRKLKERDKMLNELWRALETQLMSELDEQGQDLARAKGVATATITEEVLPNVDDWDTFYEYIREQNAFHLLQRRPGTAAYRELQAGGIEVPGVSPYIQRKISLRKSKA